MAEHRSDYESPRPYRRRSTDSEGQTVIKRLGTITVIIGIVGSIFTAGYNWREVTTIREAMSGYQKKDVAEEQYKNLTGQLEVQRYQLQQLQASMNELLRGRKE